MTQAGAPSAADVERGQQVYTPLVLRAYDLLVLGFSNRLVWKCPSARILETYDRNVWLAEDSQEAFVAQSRAASSSIRSKRT